MTDKKIGFSKKITLISFCLSIMIVELHSLWQSNNELLNRCREYIFNIQNICVPMFFMISGYLFYRNFAYCKLLNKYKSRVKTLLVPYLIWNIISFIYSLAIKYLLGAGVEIPKSFLGIVFSILNANYSVLWFVKYLIIFTIASPLIYVILKWKHSWCIIVIMLILLWKYVNDGAFLNGINLTSNHISLYIYEGIYYCIGSYIALNFKNYIETINIKRAGVSTAIIAILLVLNVISISKNIGNGGVLYWEVYRIIFCAALFFSLDLLRDFEIKWWMNISFFIYCAHMYPLQLIQELILKLSKNEIIMVISYLVMPIVVVILLILAAKIMKNKIPKLWCVLTGGRG